MSDILDVSVEPPDLVVTVNISERSDLAITLEYDLKEVLDIESAEGDVTVVDSHWHGLVVEGPDGETHHIDLRELSDTPGGGEVED